jgi:hypothetical protein
LIGREEGGAFGFLPRHGVGHDEAAAVEHDFGGANRGRDQVGGPPSPSRRAIPRRAEPSQGRTRQSRICALAKLFRGEGVVRFVFEGREDGAVYMSQSFAHKCCHNTHVADMTTLNFGAHLSIRNLRSRRRLLSYRRRNRKQAGQADWRARDQAGCRTANRRSSGLITEEGMRSLSRWLSWRLRSSRHLGSCSSRSFFRFHHSLSVSVIADHTVA